MYTTFRYLDLLPLSRDLLSYACVLVLSVLNFLRSVSTVVTYIENKRSNNAHIIKATGEGISTAKFRNVVHLISQILGTGHCTT